LSVALIVSFWRAVKGTAKELLARMAEDAKAVAS
jgi:hypothetical protein